MKSRQTVVLLGLVCTLATTPATTTPAIAATPDGDAQVTLSSRQLATSAGRVAVIDRIVETARRACVEPGFRPDTTTTSCTREVAVAIIVQVDDPELAMLWRQDRSVTRAAAHVSKSRLFAAK